MALEGDGGTLPQNRHKPFLDLVMGSFTAKENHIGPAVSEIFNYKHTHTDILLLFYKTKKM